MKSQIIEEIRSAFRDVEAPAFEKFLDRIRYRDPDQEPVEILGEIYPCSDLTQIDRYKFDEILFSLSVEAYPYVFPRALIYLLENEEGMGENFTVAFLEMILMASEYVDGQNKSLKRKSKKFYALLTPRQRAAIVAGYQELSKHSYCGDRDRLILQLAIDYLTELNKKET